MNSHALRSAFLRLGTLALIATRIVCAAAAEPGRIVVDVQSPPQPAALLYALTAEEKVAFTANQVTTQASVRVHVLQGQADTISLGLSGDADVTSVVGEALQNWSVRRETSRNGSARFIDLHVANANGGNAAREFEWTISTRAEIAALPNRLNVSLINPGGAATFSSRVMLQAAADVGLHVDSSRGLTAVGEPDEVQRMTFLGAGENQLKLSLSPIAGAVAQPEFSASQLNGALTASGHSGQFVFSTRFNAPRKGARLSVLRGHAALSGPAAGAGWHVELVGIEKDNTRYELVADQPGQLRVELSFAAPVIEQGEWRTFNFAVPAGTTVPVSLTGFDRNLTFKADAPVAPTKDGDAWKSFLPANGALALAWKEHRDAADGALFFTAEERTDVRVSAGLVRALSQLDLKILQGKLPSLRIHLEGPGEIVSVEGPNVTHWALSAAKGDRALVVEFSQPVEGELPLRITTQSELARLPAAIHPLKLVVEGALRDAGIVRLSPAASVRIDVETTQGLLQLASNQFPGAKANERDATALVFRFPSTRYDYAVTAKRIQAEVAVSQVTLYQLTDTDRIIASDIELDIREAPLREYTVLIPTGFSVAEIAGEAVKDFSTADSDAPGARTLRVEFSEPVEGRQLLHLQLEKNEPAKAEEWNLPPLRFPGAKSIRGHIGVVAAAGFRTAVSSVTELSEIPLNTFPQQTARLQQAWRLRGENWAAVVQVQPLGQSVQADVFHLYTVKSGMVSASVLINYFVVGAPATEWRIEAPSSLGNLEVLGDQVRRDWHRDGKDIVVALHQPVLGPVTLLLTFDEPLNDRGLVIHPGEIRPLNVQSERGYVEVVSSRQIHSAVEKAEGAGLLTLDGRELPAEFRLLSSAPALATYEYTDRPFSLAIDLQPYTTAETVDQVIDSATLTSTISKGGEILTDATYLAKTRSAAPLRLTLPAGLKLWAVEVDHHLVDASVDHDDLIIPFPARTEADIAVPIALRFGQKSRAGEKSEGIELLAPKVSAPVVATTWTLHSDADHLLRPISATLKPAQSWETENGFSTLGRGRSLALGIALTILAGGYWSWRRKGRWPLLAAFIAGGWALIQGWQLLVAVVAIPPAARGAKDLEYVSTYLSPGSDFSIRVTNTAGEMAGIDARGLALGLAAAALLIVSWTLRKRAPGAARFGQAAGAVGLGGGLLMQSEGAQWFLLSVLALAAVLLIGSGLDMMKDLAPALQPRLARWTRRPGENGLAGLLILFWLIAVLSAAPSARAQESGVAGFRIQETAKRVERCDQTWLIRDHRVLGTADVTCRAAIGDSFALLRPPAILSGFTGGDFRISKQDVAGQSVYVAEATRAGLIRAHLTFEMPLANYTDPIPVPTATAASQSLNVQFNQGGWDVSSDSAVQIEPVGNNDTQHSGARVILSPADQSFITLHPRQRDPAKEALEFYAEAQQLFIAGSASVSGTAVFSIRPVQGQVSELVFDVPAGMIVGDVKGSAVGLWRFDPAGQQLRVAIEPAQTKPFNVRVESQITTGPLPYIAAIAPVRVKNARGDSGLVVLAAETDVTASDVRASKFSALGSSDFDLRPFGARGAASTLQNVWHYSAEGGEASLRVATMQPEVRIESRQLFSLADDRVVASVDLAAEITRVGIFQLSFALPENLDVEALSGPALAQWSAKSEGGKRIVTLQLRERTLGATTFALTLSGPAPRSASAWKIPDITVREANRQTGTLIVVPGKGLRLRALAHEHATPLDPQLLGAVQPGTVAFKQLDADSSVTLGLEALTPWITTQLLQSVSVRDGQTATHVAAHISVENAGVKQLRLRIPGLSPAAQRTLRASGSAVSELVHLENDADVWELRFGRSVVGETDVRLDFQNANTASTPDSNARREVFPVVFTDSRQRETIVAIAAAGRLSIKVEKLASGWKPIDWSEVPDSLRPGPNAAPPAACFRVEDAAGSLTLEVSRHALAEGLKMEINAVQLTTLLSSQHGQLTAAQLHVRVGEKMRAQFSLPANSRLFGVMVNGEAVELTREDERYFFNVSPLTEKEREARIDVIYANDGAAQKPNLQAPQFDLPMENVQWRVVAPKGFHLENSAAEAGWTVATAQPIPPANFQPLFAPSAHARKGAALLDAASASLAGGDQQKAVELLQKAADAGGLDDASNEDARVQLKKVKTEQTELSLATRRQRLSLTQSTELNDPAGAAAIVAAQNPLLRDATNFDPGQLDQLLAVNSAEENEQLTDLAAHLVDHQLDRAPSPRLITPAMQAEGSVTVFTRRLQVDTSKPLQLPVELSAISQPRLFAGAAWVLVGLAVFGFLVRGRSPRTE